MAINDGDIIAVKFCQEFLGQNVCMVWTITTENPSGPIDITELAEKIRDYIGPFINAAQVGTINNTSVAVENLTDGVSFGEASWTGSGLYVGVTTPPFVAAGIRLNRGNKITRNGYKRVPGMAEEVITGGYFTTEFIEGELTDLAQAFSEPGLLIMDDSETVQFAPVIVGRNASGFDLSRVQQVKSATVLSAATTQNSRKFGVGS